ASGPPPPPRVRPAQPSSRKRSPGSSATRPRGSARGRPCSAGTVAKPARASYRRGMLGWRRVSLVGPAGRLRAPAQVAAECGEQDGGVLLTAHRFGQVVPYARLLCRHLAASARPWAAESELGAGREPGLLPFAARGRGLAWAARVLHRHRAIWRRTGIVGAESRAALVANYRLRRAIMREPTGEPTPAMRLARVLARPIRIRERVPFVSTLVGAVAAG